ncbi:Swt1 family HEPN domain-containing protein [Bradyrhizobium sp. CER78]|uniref:Swt1 family HEPN domain-containing protein n=1 Tax=Bradyrhizobium sp. CER78 TaxID=3039162 RepID=UPI00244D1091|nr:Swt1 family HEPN domain-containing protein [Bradyrhizobium sp. CER78]MDH2384563.1 Swt1 family HEPN domain-containing protein [Bradyrhizobium sp. CER78]
MASRPDGFIRAFGMAGLQISLSMSKIEREFGIDLGHETKTAAKNRKAAEYEQFEAMLRSEAAQMSEFYEVFYCLENSIRKLVADVMVEDAGADWWNGTRVDEDKIRKPAASRRKKEIDSGITPRSDRLIDYTTFGELSQLITDNWELFDPIFQSKTAVSNVSNQLNLLRGPIAHCNPTDELEQERLNLAVRTWFKIMS